MRTVPDNGRIRFCEPPWKQAKLREKAQADPESQAGRNMIFRRLLPGTFLVVYAYYIFSYQPSIADFYCAVVHGWITQAPVAEFVDKLSLA